MHENIETISIKEFLTSAKVTFLKHIINYNILIHSGDDEIVIYTDSKYRQRDLLNSSAYKDLVKMVGVPVHVRNSVIPNVQPDGVSVYQITRG